MSSVLPKFCRFFVYDRFKVSVIDDLIKVMSEYKDVYVMLDIGDSSFDEAKLIFSIIINKSHGDKGVLNRIIAGGRTKAQVDAQKELYRFPLINMYCCCCC